MITSKSNFTLRVAGLVALSFLAGGLFNNAAAGEFYSVTAIATQTSASQDPYQLSAEDISDQLTTEFVEQLIEDLDQRLPTELSEHIASLR
ncbi:MAG: hypothetical protein HKN70_06815 [Gammaproteobacteria bacterium]|nr:hypothetical protein [Gammaproteobacteria bacterium]